MFPPRLRTGTKVFFAIAGADEYALRTFVVSEFDIAVTIAYDEGAVQIDGVFARGAIKHSRLRLAAIAGFGIAVGTVVDRSEMRACCAELLGHKFVDGEHGGLRKITATNTRLIGDDDHRQVGIVQAANRGGRGRKHTKMAEIIQVSDFFGDGAVAVEKNGGAEWL